MPRSLVDYLNDPGGEQDDLTEGLANVIATASGPAKVVLSAALNSAIGTVLKTVSGTTYTLVNADHGHLIIFTGACTITVPSGLRSDFSCGWLQGGASQLTFAASGTTIREPNSFTKSERQWASGGVASLGSETYLLLGRTGT